MSEYKEILNAIIEMKVDFKLEMTEIKERLGSLEQGQTKLDKRLDHLEQSQKRLEVGQNDLAKSVNYLVEQTIQNKKEIKLILKNK